MASENAVVDIAQAILTALNVGDVQSESALHLKLREVMIDYRRAPPPPAAAPVAWLGKVDQGMGHWHFEVAEPNAENAFPVYASPPAVPIDAVPDVVDTSIIHPYTGGAAQGPSLADIPIVECDVLPPDEIRVVGPGENGPEVKARIVNVAQGPSRGLYRGKAIELMTREELMNALVVMGELYKGNLLATALDAKAWIDSYEATKQGGATEPTGGQE